MIAPATVTPDPRADNPPRSRRWIPLSLRLFVGILIAVGLLFAPKGVQIYRQQIALRKIERIGAFVATEPGQPAWVRPWLPAGWLTVIDPVVQVDFYALKGSAATELVTDDVLLSVAEFKGLTFLDVRHSQISNFGLAHLANLHELRWLNLSGTGITNDGLMHLHGLENLEDLEFSRTRINDDGLDALKGLSNLKRVDCFLTDVTPQGASDFTREFPAVRISR